MRVGSLFVGAFGASVLCGGASFGAQPLDLNGSWEFRFEEGKSIEQSAGADFAADDTMVVPACYDMLPKYLCKRGTGLYRRSFKLEKPVENAWIVVDGMGLRGEFKIDGKSLGIHPYPWARLEMATGKLSAGEHTIFAALDNRFDWQTMKLARPYYDFYCYGGFYHGMKLEFDNRKLRVRTRDHAAGKVEIEAVGFKDGNFDAMLEFDGKARVSARFVNSRAVVEVPNARPWSPEAPNLHTVEVDGITARFGIRTVKARDRRLWLNGKPLYLKGANRHESHPTFGAATSEALMLADIQNLKSLGGNFFRGCHYQQCQRFLDLCDENGVLVWEESLGWGNGSHSPMAKYELTNETFRAQQVLETREMVRASINHPCVIISAFMNEFQSGSQAGRTLADELIKTIHAEDSGHLVSFACSHIENDISCTNVDIVAFNTYPGWIGTEPGTTEQLAESISKRVGEVARLFRKRYPEKPIMVSEMGCCGVYGHHDPAGAQWTEEFQAEYVGDVCRSVLSQEELCGLAIWQFTDARSYHRDGASVRSKPFAENLAGLYDAYRRPKAVVPVVEKWFKGKQGNSKWCAK